MADRIETTEGHVTIRDDSGTTRVRIDANSLTAFLRDPTGRMVGAIGWGEQLSPTPEADFRPEDLVVLLTDRQAIIRAAVILSEEEPFVACYDELGKLIRVRGLLHEPPRLPIGQVASN